MSYEAWRAICRLTDANDQIEQALRLPGERLDVTRQVLEEIRDDIRAARRLIRDAGDAR